MNLYAYVGNDPINASDPSGMTTCLDSKCERSAIDTDVDGDGTVDVTFKNDNPQNPPPPNDLDTDTAKLVENSIKESGVDTVNINSTTGGKHGKHSRHPGGKAVDIDTVNGKPANANNPGVKKLQDAASNQQNIRENFGPASNTKTVITYDPKQERLEPK